MQVCFTGILECVMQVCKTQVRVTQVCVTQVRVIQVCVTQVGMCYTGMC